MKKATKILNEKNGFSLVELIVVIVIMLILAAVMVPNVAKYINSAAESVVQSDAATVLTELQAEVADAVARSIQRKTTFKPESLKCGKVDVTYCTTSDSAKFSDGYHPAGARYFYDKTTKRIETFSYSDGTNYVIWTYSKGWWNVNDATEPSN